ncbi:endoribonuclease YbeY isoform X1 [Echinops telfairi]|uniref:Endoribonuclease YbeY isoform X1 n=3 Tax=Echinops telfairi TaxID=9371 RepID=A0AC55CMY6_ECHTE|nr:endoribonuclease YbeY isoform X1 [Echinops telfairi]XP_045140352.1 endoribonuclease YbeY isoform X1 [Echinops telfairi]XP_045140353.1 endoribonuclease YbeY isoform X1 [Echinops telfairi]
MSLVLRNLQRVVPIRRVPLRRKIELVRRVLGVQKFDLGVICVDNKTIQHINRIYREKNVPTDVLSFPFHENLKAGEIPQPDCPDDCNLGDIFLGVEYILQQCKAEEDYYDILTVTATHGLCHLLGFTHDTESAWQKLQSLLLSLVLPFVDVPEGEAGSGGVEPAHGDQTAAPEQGPLLMGAMEEVAARAQQLQHGLAGGDGPFHFGHTLASELLLFSGGNEVLTQIGSKFHE